MRIPATILGQFGAHLTDLFCECFVRLSSILIFPQLQFHCMHFAYLRTCHGSLSLTDNLYLKAKRTNVSFGGLYKLVSCSLYSRNHVATRRNNRKVYYSRKYLRVLQSYFVRFGEELMLRCITNSD